jgi:hypothetical protein
MLVTFTTDSYPNITMFGNNALAMLKMMGHSATVPGAIKAEDIPQALSRLKAAMESASTLPATSSDNMDEPVVSMGHRGQPLIELFSAAEKAKGHVMWDKSTSLR